MTLKFLLVCSLLTLTASLGMADDKKDECKEGDKNCHPPRLVCFNLFCNYERQGKGQGDGGYDKCKAASTFNKWVSDDGYEILDEAESSEKPVFQVACDGNTIFNNSAHRYTDEQGTRIQAVQGPFPAVVIPRDALRDTHHYVISALELYDQTMRGDCYIYTGEAIR